MLDMKSLLTDENARRAVLVAMGYVEGETCSGCKHFRVEATEGSTESTFVCSVNAGFNVVVSDTGTCKHLEARAQSTVKG